MPFLNRERSYSGFWLAQVELRGRNFCETYDFAVLGLILNSFRNSDFSDPSVDVSLRAMCLDCLGYTSLLFYSLTLASFRSREQFSIELKLPSEPDFERVSSRFTLTTFGSGSGGSSFEHSRNYFANDFDFDSLALRLWDCLCFSMFVC
jgi:hypothetical protein